MECRAPIALGDVHIRAISQKCAHRVDIAAHRRIGQGRVVARPGNYHHGDEQPKKDVSEFIHD